MRTFTFLILALFVAPVVLADSATPREATARYVGFTPVLTWDLGVLPDCSSEHNMAGACFPFAPTEGNATITATDDRGARVCLTARITNATGEHHALFCDEGRVNLRALDGATTLRVVVRAAGLLAPPPTEGTIRVLFEA